MNNIDEIIKEIALEHGIVLPKQDPAFLFAKVNEKLLAHYARQLLVEQSNQQAAIGILIERNNQKATESSSKAIHKAGHYVYDQVIDAAKKLSELAGKDVRTEGLILLRELEQFRSVFKAECVTLRHEVEKTGTDVARQIRTFQWIGFGITVLLTGMLGAWIGMCLGS